MTTNACTRRMGTFVFKAFRKGHDKQRGWTQVYMAEHVGMDRSFIRIWKTGRRKSVFGIWKCWRMRSA